MDLLSVVRHQQLVFLLECGLVTVKVFPWEYGLVTVKVVWL